MVNAAWVAFLAVLALIVTAVLAHSSSHGPPCLFRASVGIPCPGCGMTRSLQAIWHGDLPSAVRYHPLGLPVFVALLATAFLSTIYVAAPAWRPRMRRLTARLPQPALGWVAVGLFLAVWLLRLVDALMHGGNFWW